MNESIELENFNKEKLKNFKLQRNSRESRDSRPSDPENNDIFRKTMSDFNGKDNLFKRADNSEDIREGVDDYEEDPRVNRSIKARKMNRSSLAEQYRFEGI